MTKITYKFPTGLEVTGTIEELETIAKSLKLKIDFSKIDGVPRGYYPSESKGLTKISEMNEYWLRKALLKRAKDYFAEIYNAEDSIRLFQQKFISLASDSIIEDLYNELEKRS